MILLKLGVSFLQSQTEATARGLSEALGHLLECGKRKTEREPKKSSRGHT